jgi:hypothetical protein
MGSPLEHGLEQPGVGGVLVADVLLQLPPGPIALHLLGEWCAPRLDALACLVDVEVVDNVPEAEETSGAKHRTHSAESHHLPEVWEVMQGVRGERPFKGPSAALPDRLHRVHTPNAHHP